MSTQSDEPEQTPEPKRSVGYCSPPDAARFRKGQSGNPKGRPKGSLNVATMFAKALREKVVINENGQRRTVTKLEAALKQLVNLAASGNIRALRQLLELALDAETKQNARAGQEPGFSDLDREVIDGILQRFQGGEGQSLEPRKGDHCDDERS